MIRTRAVYPERPILRRLGWTFLVLAGLMLGACQRSAGTLDRVLETGELRVGMDASFPPFEYVDGEGNLAGFDVELGRALAARLGVEARFVANLPYDGLYDALTAERVDIVISALYVDPGRMDDFAYSAAYFDAGQVLVTTQGSPIAGMEDLNGQTLAVELGSEGDALARSWAQRLVGLSIMPCLSIDEVLAKVAAGEANAALVDHLSALSGAEEVTALRIVGQPVAHEPYAVAMLRDSRALLRFVQEALADMEDDGTLPQLRERWLSAGS